MLWIPDHRRRRHQRHRPLLGLAAPTSNDAASKNIGPWGILIGGEELHNNHHTYPTSAKLSVKPYEFDIGWVYIRGLEMLGLAQVRKTPPTLRLGMIKPVADDKTLEAIITNRYEVMAKYARSLRRASRAEVQRLIHEGKPDCAKLANLRLVKRWLHRDADQIPTSMKPQVALAIEHSPLLAKLIAMREEAAPALDPHQRLGRATRRRPASLVQEGRGERHRRPPGIRAEAAGRARVAASRFARRAAGLLPFLFSGQLVSQ